MIPRICSFALVFGLVGAAMPSTVGSPRLPQDPIAVVNELLDADRGFSTTGAGADLVTSLSAMFAPEVIMPVQGVGLVRGIDPVVEALRRQPDIAGATGRWTPIRGGVSGDGLHGFTFGFMVMKTADGKEVPFKYLAYWVKGPNGWRVVGYRRRPRPAGEASMTAMAPAIPKRVVAPQADPAVIERYRVSLDRTERAFSDEAQRIGLGPAFVKFGSEDAVNMGGANEPGFVIGAKSIATTVSAGGPAHGSALRWAPDYVMVASSGDLGITFGIIRPNDPAAGPPTGYPFFTIWRRGSPDQPWRYVAE